MQFSRQAQGIVKLRGVAVATFRGRRSIYFLCVGGVDARICVVRAEVIVAVTVGLACERVFSGGVESRNCLAGLLDARAPMGLPAPLDFLRISRAKRSFWRPDG